MPDTTPQKPFLFFDFDDTLVDFVAGARNSMETVLKNVGITMKPEDFDVYQEINMSWWKRYETGAATKDELRHGRISDFLQRMNWTNPDPREVEKHFMDGIASHVVLYPKAQEVIGQLKSDGWAMGLITNGLPDVQPQRITKAGFQGVFDPVIISSQIGYQKPDPRIFKAAMDQAKTTGKFPADLNPIMIGDNLDADIGGARNMGWDVIWFNPTKKTGQETLMQFMDWSDLPDLLDSFSTSSHFPIQRS